MTVTLRKWKTTTCNYIYLNHLSLLFAASYLLHIHTFLKSCLKQILEFFQSLKVLDQEAKSYATAVSKHTLHSCIVLVIQQLNWILTSISKSLCILMFGKNKDSCCHSWFVTKFSCQKKYSGFYTTCFMLWHAHWQITVHCLDSLIRAWNGKSLNLLTFRNLYSCIVPILALILLQIRLQAISQI